MDEVSSIAEAQKASLLKQERATASSLVRAYGLAYSRIQERVAALTAQIDDARSRGAVISAGWLYERDRLSNLKIEIEREMRNFASTATAKVTAEQSAAIETAATDAQKLLSASVSQSATSPGPLTGALNPEAVASIAGSAGDGSPLRLLFDKVAPQVSQAIAEELAAGVAESAPTRVIASRIRERSGIGLARSLLIARQETLRAYRTAAIETYKASGVVTAWRWLSAQDTRTCIICVLMDGTEFPLAVPLNSHVGCRCTLIPVTANTPPARKGIDRFKELETGVQRELLGAGRYEAWKRGELDLNNLVGVRRDPQWGATRYARSLKEMESAPAPGGGGSGGGGATPPGGSGGSGGQGGGSPEDPFTPKRVTIHADQAARSTAEKLFGRALSDQELAEVAGAISDSHVLVEARGEMLLTSVKHPDFKANDSFIKRDEAGKLFIRKDEVAKSRSAGDSRVGLFSLVPQVRRGRELGVDYLSAFIEGSLRTLPHRTGYYVWARYGFDAPLTEAEIGALPARFQGVRTVAELINHGGRDYWKEKGSEREAFFALTNESISLLTLQDYLRNRGFDVKL